MNNAEWIEWPIYTKETVDKVLEVFNSKRYAISGYYTGKSSMEQEFAKAFAAFNQVPYCVPATNGSSSLLMGLEALDIGFGDEVIVPAFTWIATATSVLNVNAFPVLVDVDHETYCIDPKLIEESITEKTKAIMPVHLYGCMADMDAILGIAQKYKLRIIEDCAQTHGSVWNGKKAGTIGDIGAFSFQQSKTLTSGEGGCTITKDPVLFDRLEQLRSDSRVFSEKKLEYGDLELIAKGTIQGSNYCMSEFQAAVLIEQLSKLDEMNRIREDNARYLDENLGRINGLKPMKRLPQIEKQSYFSYCIRLDTDYFNSPNDQILLLLREKVIKSLRQRLQLGQFYLHSPYSLVSKNPLFCPWTKKRFPKTISKTENYWRSLQFPVAERATRESIIFHHSILLQPKGKLDFILESFAEILNTLRKP